MLTLTETASTVVKTIVSTNTEAETGGLRIAGTDSDPSDFSLTIANTPEPTDSIVEQDGARVFLEPSAAITLDDKVLDAEIDEKGAVMFALGVAA